jgi:hypothetical protein
MPSKAGKNEESHQIQYHVPEGNVCQEEML